MTGEERTEAAGAAVEGEQRTCLTPGTCPANHPRHPMWEKSGWGLHYHYGNNPVAFLRIGDTWHRITPDQAEGIAGSLRHFAVTIRNRRAARLLTGEAQR